MKFSRIILIINPLLLGYFFIIFLYSSNLGEGIRLTEFFSLFFLVSIFSCLVFFPCLLILKKLEKASFLSIILLFIFYSYGYFYDFFNEIILVKELSRHRYLIPILSLFLFLLLIRISRKNNDYKVLTNIIFITLSTLILINLSQALIFNVSPTNPLAKDLDIEIYNYNDSSDVYHIVLDMYPTDKILKTGFNFDNKDFSNKLNNLGFRKEDLKANYIRTMYSLPSTINMKHFNNAESNEILFMKETEKSFTKSVEAHVAEKLGFEIHEISTNDVKNFYSSFFGDFSRIFMRTNMLRVIDDSSIPIHNFWINKNQKYFHENFSSLIEKSNDNKKTWTYFYSRPPHPPFIFNEDGSKNLSSNPYNSFSEDLSDIWSDKDKQDFINQLKYVNKMIIEAVEEIILNSKDSIIIIHSDHGVSNISGKDEINTNKELANNVYEELFSTINFIYTPDNCINESHNIKTNINIIPALLKECFNLNIEYNDNSQFWNETNTEEFILIK